MAFTAAAALGAAAPKQPDQEAQCCSVFELRNYELKQGRRSELAAIFDAEFVETQEAYGLKVVGQFLDVENPTRFVWIRASRDHEHRAQALSGFYDESEAWKKFGRRASDTMSSIDDVYLLKPAFKDAAKGLLAPSGAQNSACNIVSVLIFDISRDVAVDQASLPSLPKADWEEARFLGALRSDRTLNSFPRHPVRADADVIALVLHHADIAAFHEFRAGLATKTPWGVSVRAKNGDPAMPNRILLLQPTPRSKIR